MIANCVWYELHINRVWYQLHNHYIMHMHTIRNPGCYVWSMRCVMGARCIDSSRLGHRMCFHVANHPRLSILSPGVRGSKLVVSVQVLYTLSLHNNIYTNHLILKLLSLVKLIHSKLIFISHKSYFARSVVLLHNPLIGPVIVMCCMIR